MNTILEITKVSDVKTSKDGRNFKTIEFKPLQEEVMIAGKIRSIKSNQPSRVKNIWATGPNGSKGDSLYADANVGDIVRGQIVTKNVVPYDIDGREVNTATIVVLDNETIEQAFDRANHPIVLGDGTIVTSKKTTLINQQSVPTATAQNNVAFVNPLT